MILGIYAIKDRAADAFGRPFFCPTDGVAIRSFMDEVGRQDPENQLFQHPDDFDLYRLGSYDDSDGSFSEPVPKLLTLGKQVKG